MKLTKTIHTIRKDTITVGYKCDICGKEHNDILLPENWHEFTIQHYAWEYDVWDTQIVCSVECYFKFLQEAVSTYKNEKFTHIQIDEFNLQFAEQICNFINK